jgi:hypothetical protein
LSTLDDGGRHYSNMTTNFSKVFNNLLKEICGLPIMAIMQMTFFSSDKYFIELKAY